MALRAHPAVTGEVVEIHAWYAQSSRRAADQFLRALDEAIDQVRVAPLRAALRPDGSRRVRLRKYPHSVIYQIEADGTAHVVAVAHGSRRAYWRHRLT